MAVIVRLAQCADPSAQGPRREDALQGASAAPSQTTRLAALRFPSGGDHILQDVKVESGASDDVIADNEARCSVNI